jgi:Ca2+-binding EF-hand superfamily protein
MQQFEVALKLLGLNVTKKEFKKICKRADKNGDDKIDFEEFKRLVLSYSFNYSAEELTHRSGNASIGVTPRPGSPRKDQSQE